MKVSAGFCGPDVRGDCRATVWEPVGTPEVLVNSRVDALYGRSIAALADEVLEALGASHLSLSLEDEGALPFTIGARIESAVRLLGIDASLIPPKIQNPKSKVQNPKHRPRRSRLYLPGNTPKFFINAGLYGADSIILDLEDSVPPAEKDAARVLVRNALAAVDFMGAERIVRINSGQAGEADMRALKGQNFDTVIVPKAESPDEIERLTELTDAWLIPLIETARGVARAPEIADCSEKVCALAFGVEDYLADIGARSADEAMWAMGQIVNSARAAGVAALGPVHADLDDHESLRHRVERMAAMGFEGFSCIHPMQVRHVHFALQPSAEEVQAAEAQILGYRAAIASGKGAVAIEGTMVDAPVAARAERVLRRAGRAI